MLVMMFCLLMGGRLALAEESSTAPSKKKAVRLEKVMVTADKTTSKDVNQLPMSVSVLSGEELDDYQISQADQLTNLLPNVNYQKMGSHWTEISFRGMGAMTNMIYTSYSSLDGVSMPYVGGDAFFDVERIEVVRGGVGSLFGRNTHAGHINIITKDPGHTLNAQVRARYGSFNTYEVTGAAGGPVSDKLGVRLAARFTGTDGWIENDYYHRDDTNDSTQASGRGKIVFSPSDTCDITLSLNVDRFDSANDSFANVDNGGNVHTFNDLLGHDDGTMLSPILRVQKRFGSLELTSITAYVDTTYDTQVDQDMSSLDAIILDYQEDYQTLSQELRLATADPEAAWQWMGGLYLMHQKGTYKTKFGFGSQADVWGFAPGIFQRADSELTTDNVALFGQVQYRPWKKVELTVALRLDWERIELDWTGTAGQNGINFSSDRFNGDQDWLAFLPRASAAYLLTPKQRVYATIYRGYRSGAYDVLNPSLEVVQNEVEPEYTTTYEVGYKASLLDKRLSLRASVFYVDWRDIQLSAVQGGVEILQNAGEAHSYGLEAEVSWLALPGLHILASMGLISAELDEYKGHPSGKDLAGNHIPNTPEYKLTLGGVYRHSSGIFAQASASCIGKKYLDELNGYEQDAIVLVDAKLGYEADRWAIYAWGENLTDELYVVRAENYFGLGYYGRTGQPLAVGVELKFRF
jgi:iron complex outermembrane receptor protein